MREPAGPPDQSLCTGRQQRGHAVGRRRCVAEISDDGATPLHLLGTNEISAFHHAGPRPPERCILAEDRARHRSADDETILAFSYVSQGVYSFDVDDELGFDEAPLHSHQQITSAGQNGCLA